MKKLDSLLKRILWTETRITNRSLDTFMPNRLLLEEMKMVFGAI